MSKSSLDSVTCADEGGTEEPHFTAAPFLRGKKKTLNHQFHLLKINIDIDLVKLKPIMFLYTVFSAGL